MRLGGRIDILIGSVGVKDFFVGGNWQLLADRLGVLLGDRFLIVLDRRSLVLGRRRSIHRGRFGRRLRVGVDRLGFGKLGSLRCFGVRVRDLLRCRCLGLNGLGVGVDNFSSSCRLRVGVDRLGLCELRNGLRRNLRGLLERRDRLGLCNWGNRLSRCVWV